MSTITLPESKQKYFCMAVPYVASINKAEMIEGKEVVEFLDPDSGKTYKAIREDMIWYPLGEISEFHAKTCMQMNAEDLRSHMMKKYGLTNKNRIFIVQYAKCPETNE